MDFDESNEQPSQGPSEYLPSGEDEKSQQD